MVHSIRVAYGATARVGPKLISSAPTYRFPGPLGWLPV